jgi:hypothetical protein
MAIELHVKRIHTDNYNHLKRRIRKCLLKMGILIIYIIRKIFYYNNGIKFNAVKSLTRINVTYPPHRSRMSNPELSPCADHIL